MTMTFTAEGWITYARAATLLGVSRMTVYNYVRTGRLKTVVVVGNTHYLSRAEVEEKARNRNNSAQILGEILA